jgi:hypothetical protein
MILINIKMKNLSLLVLCMFMANFAIKAQDVDKTETNFEFIQLPKKPLDKSIKNYQSKVVYNVEEVNNKIMAEHKEKVAKAEQEYQTEMAAYPQKVKDAEAQYLKELEIYEKKSTIQKIADQQLANGGKPIKTIPSPPYKTTYPEPKLKKSFNNEQLAGTYLKLEGFSNASTNAVTITAILGELEVKEPELTVKDMTKIANGTSTPYKAYYMKVPYKRLITLKVETAQGVIYNEVPAEISQDQYFNIPGEYTSESSIRSWWTYNQEKTIEGLELSSVDNGLKIIQNLLNSDYAFKKTKREAIVYQVKDKKQDYSDLATAYLALVEGYNGLSEDYEKKDAKVKIQEAITIYEKALTESDLGNKKARINEEVTLAIYVNLMEAYIWMDEYAKSKTLYTKFTTLDAPKRFVKMMEEINKFGKEQYERYKLFNGK